MDPNQRYTVASGKSARDGAGRGVAGDGGGGFGLVSGSGWLVCPALAGYEVLRSARGSVRAVAEDRGGSHAGLNLHVQGPFNQINYFLIGRILFSSFASFASN